MVHRRSASALIHSTTTSSPSLRSLLNGNTATTTTNSTATMRSRRLFVMVASSTACSIVALPFHHATRRRRLAAFTTTSQPPSSSTTTVVRRPSLASYRTTSTTALRGAAAAPVERPIEIGPPTNNDDVLVRGTVLNRQSNDGGGRSFVVVRVLEDTTWDGTATTTTTTTEVLPTAVKNLFGTASSSSSFPTKVVAPPITKKMKMEAGAEDPTGRIVTFTDGSWGTVVAHRDPISFVLVANSFSSSSRMEKDAPTAASAVEGVGDEEICTISSSRTTIDPTCIVPGMIVDYLGRQLDVIASSSSSTNNNGLMATALKKDEDYNTNNSSNNNEEGKLRPIFVPIPKISDIGLIDSPLITGITAIDALTPIGKGQNMLIIGTEEEEEEEGNDAIHRGEGGGLVDEKNKKVRGLNKRGWMINLLRNVITNHRRSSSTSANDANEVTNMKSKEMRCFYCLTSADQKVRARVLNDISNAGIRDEVVTVLSSSSATSSSFSLTSNDDCIGAAEAVAAAATACTLAEHHALTTGGDAIVIIDDINLHKTLWDITTRELVNVYGTNSVVEADLNGGSSSEMRGYFSGLIQRAARFNTKRGGGSVTLILLSTLPNPDETDMDGNKEDNDDDATTTYDASDFDTMSEKIRTRIRLLVSAKVPLTAANLRKIKLPIPRPSPAEDRRRLALQHIEDLISMSDGQVWLDVSMIGRSPPLDPSRSITRVGVGADTLTCRADAPALRSVVGSLRFEFQQALDLSPDTLSSSSSLKGIAGGEEDNDNARQVRRRDAFLLAMHQEVHEGRKLSHECTLLLAASRGHLDDVLAKGGKAGTSLGRDMIEGLLEYVTNETETGEIIRSIDETLELSLEGRDLLENAIVSYFSKS